MQISTDILNANFTPDCFVGGNVGPSAQPQQPVPPKAAAGLIDWNSCPPDGTDESLQLTLSRLATAFRGAIHFGLQGEDGELTASSAPSTEVANIRSAIRSSVAEAVSSSQSCLFATASGQSSLVLQQLRQQTDYALVLSFSGGHVAGGQATTSIDVGESFSMGIVVCIRQAEQLQGKEVYATLIASTQQQLRKWLQVWRQCRVGTKISGWRRRLHFYRRRRGQVALLIVGCLLASMAIPVPYWPQRPCTVEPASKSFVASPIDGRIREATVRPGDLVAQGQVLAHLDDEQLRWQLSAAQADYETASKKRDTALANRAGGELRLAQLEQERIAVQLESLQRQLERLELRSPTDGVVVQGDWFQSDGAPVSRGDMLFEIAAMDDMRVEIHLSTDDLARISVGDQATVRVDAAPGAKWTAELNRIDPRGKVVDAEVVFGANIDVSNESNQLRPGMRGTARISADQQTIGWLLFHRPTLWAMKKLAW